MDVKAINNLDNCHTTVGYIFLMERINNNTLLIFYSLYPVVLWSRGSLHNNFVNNKISRN
jgi:hypothetical protein